MRWLIYISLSVSLLVSCKTHNILHDTRAERKALSKQLDSAFWYNPNYQYVIRKDDKISISIWGQDEISVGSVYGIYNSNEVYGKWLLVDAEGLIEAPRIGSIHVLGMTIPQLKDTLQQLIKPWIVNPIVDVKVLNKEITVMGEVRNPAVVKVDKDRNTLLEIISHTGGFEFYANLKHVKILRQEGEHVYVANVDLTESGDVLSKNIQLHPGDVVVVPSRGNKQFDKRISTIIPFATVVSAAAILLGFFNK